MAFSWTIIMAASSRGFTAPIGAKLDVSPSAYYYYRNNGGFVEFRRKKRKLISNIKCCCSDSTIPINSGNGMTIKCERHYVKQMMVDGGSGSIFSPSQLFMAWKSIAIRSGLTTSLFALLRWVKRDTIGEIDLVLTIGHVIFRWLSMFWVETSYIILLGRS